MNMNAAALALLMGLLLTMAGCGGGDQGQRANVNVLPDELLTPPCPTCQPATVQGVAAAGAPFADAEVTVIDSQGVRRQTRTDASGRYQLNVQGMAAPFLIRVSGLLHAQTRTLHTVVLPTEVGRALSNVTPLTEVLAAQVLQGLPHDLLQEQRVDYRRINTRTVRSAQAELERLVRPVLDAAGVAPLSDLRASPFEADHTGMDLALDGLVLTQEHGAYRLRHVMNPPGQALVIDPTGASSTEPLAAPPSPASLQALPGLVQQIGTVLDELTALYANRIATPAELAPFLTADFLGNGLDAAAHLSQILRRQDAASAGGYSLQGARWSDVSVLQIQDDSHVLVAFRVTPRAPFGAYTETAWMQKTAGRWQLKGNGQLARVRVRHAAVLGAGPKGDSTTVRAYLNFEVDRRQVDPRVSQIVVKGPGLPDAGLTLAAPTDDDEDTTFWSWSGRRSDDWPAVPVGWCPDAGDAQLVCQESWTEVRTGSTYQFTLLDAGGQTLQTLTASLPDKPDAPEVLASQATRWFNRLAASPPGADDWLPTSDHVLAASPSPYRGDVPLAAQFQVAAGALQGLEALFDLYVEAPPTAHSNSVYSRVRVRRGFTGLAQGPFTVSGVAWPAMSGIQQPRWAVLRLSCLDAVGNRYIHALSPSNPR